MTDHIAATADHGRAVRNTLVLSTAQALYGTNAIVMFTLGAIVGYSMADDKSLATLPLSVMLLGAAVATVPASLLMQKVGRRSGFLVGATFGLVGSLVAVYAITIQSFWLFCLASHLTGYYQAFAQYYRFAAADTAEGEFRAKAISLVLAGGLVAAMLGPVVVSMSKDIFAPAIYAGCYLVLASITGIAIVVLSFLKIPLVPPASHGGEAPRPLRVILKQRRLLAAIGAGVVSYGTMSFVMTATPLAMVAHHHSVADAADTISWHVVAMYAPSFFTGALIAKFGKEKIILTGLALLALCAVFALLGIALWNFTVALVLLGLGWNLGFIGATTTVTDYHRPSERGQVQAVNDLCVFSFVAFASFMSGKLLDVIGWVGVNYVVFPFVFLAGCLLFVVVWLEFQRPKSRLDA